MQLCAQAVLSVFATQMVLDAGRLVEFDAPKVLLQDAKSLLRALVEESADKETLYAMAEGKQA